MYQPGEYTHQGVHAKTADYGHYPWPNPEKKWDKDYIRSRLAPVRAFEKKYNAKIYVGEFSAINWAEGADRYIADCIDVFNEYNWDWTFHAFREWAGWSVEHVGTNARDLHSSSDNPRKRALLEGLRKGRRLSRSVRRTPPAKFDIVFNVKAKRVEAFGGSGAIPVTSRPDGSYSVPLASCQGVLIELH